MLLLERNRVVKERRIIIINVRVRIEQNK